jgi:hypothetical protein
VLLSNILFRVILELLYLFSRTHNIIPFTHKTHIQKHTSHTHLPLKTKKQFTYNQNTFTAFLFTNIYFYTHDTVPLDR